MFGTAPEIKSKSKFSEIALIGLLTNLALDSLTPVASEHMHTIGDTPDRVQEVLIPKVMNGNLCKVLQYFGGGEYGLYISLDGNQKHSKAGLHKSEPVDCVQIG